MEDLTMEHPETENGSVLLNPLQYEVGVVPSHYRMQFLNGSLVFAGLKGTSKHTPIFSMQMGLLTINLWKKKESSSTIENGWNSTLVLTKKVMKGNFLIAKAVNSTLGSSLHMKREIV